MTFSIDEGFLPAVLMSHPMTDDEFAAFCAEHPDLRFEATSEGELIVMPPTYSWTGASNLDLGSQLAVWAPKDGRGVACDSSTGFVLPNGSRRSPDVSWTQKSRIAQLDPSVQGKFWHLCPDFVIELQSTTDRPRLLRDKMRDYMANGAQLAWLIQPQSRSVTVYRPNHEPETQSNINKLAADGPVHGFVLHLASIWNPLGEKTPPDGHGLP